VTTDIPQNLFSDRNWMGFAMCAVFPFHKHPTAVRRNLESGIPHRVICELQTDIAGMSPISTPYSISEDEVLISLYQRAFLWLSFTPSGNCMGKHVWNQMSWAKFSFVSDTPDVSSAVKCGVNLVYRHNFDEFTRTIVQLLTSYADYMHLIRNSSKKNEPTVYKMLPMYHENVPRPDSSIEEDPRPLNSKKGAHSALSSGAFESRRTRNSQAILPNGPTGKNIQLNHRENKMFSNSLFSLYLIFFHLLLLYVYISI
jgi:hypothetical protein